MDLLTLLYKVKQEISDDCLTVIFDYKSRQTVRSVIYYVRRSLSESFVPQNIEPASITRLHSSSFYAVCKCLKLEARWMGDSIGKTKSLFMCFSEVRHSVPTLTGEYNPETHGYAQTCF